VVGVAIAVSFLAGTSLAIDSSVSIAMGSYLSRLDRDFTIFAQTAQARQLADNLSAVPGVTFVAPYRQIAAGSEFSTGNLTGGLPYAVDPNRLPPFLATWHLSGTMVLARGSTVVSGDLAARFVVGIGDTIELRASTFNVTSRVTETRFVNLTVQGLLDAPTNGVSLINGPSFSSFLLIHLDDADWLDSVLTSRVTPRTSVDVLIDRGALLNAYDIEGSRRNLARLQRGLATVAHSYNGSVGDMVSSILGYVETFSGLARQLFFALSMPIIFLGLYVGAIGVDLAHSERRRHLSILKARGANSRQILELLILESLITGSLSAGVGLIAGLGISRVLVGSVSGFFASTPAPTEIVVAPITIILTLLFGTLFMFIISYRSAKRTAGIAAVETLRFYIASETRLNYRPTLDIFFLAVGVGAFGLFLAHGAGVGVVSFFGGPVAFVLLLIAANPARDPRITPSLRMGEHRHRPLHQGPCQNRGPEPGTKSPKGGEHRRHLGSGPRVRHDEPFHARRIGSMGRPQGACRYRRRPFGHPALREPELCRCGFVCAGSGRGGGGQTGAR